MTLPAFASFDDVETRLRVSFDSGQLTQVTEWLDDASVLVRAETGRDWIDDGGGLSATEAQLDALRSVTARAVARMFRNPDGATQEAAGPFSRSLAGQDGPWLTKGDKKILGRLAPDKLWALSTTRGDLETRPVRDDLWDAIDPSDPDA